MSPQAVGFRCSTNINHAVLNVANAATDAKRNPGGVRFPKLAYDGPVDEPAIVVDLKGFPMRSRCPARGLQRPQYPPTSELNPGSFLHRSVAFLERLHGSLSTDD